MKKSKIIPFPSMKVFVPEMNCNGRVIETLSCKEFPALKAFVIEFDNKQVATYLEAHCRAAK